MIVKALISFAGTVSMNMGETRDISDLSVVKDLIKAGYVEEVKAPRKEKQK